ncbi:MAG: ABC transporter ATP-binding protein [Trueperaceae bacterium]
MTSSIAINQLTKSFQNIRAVNGVSFGINENEFFSLVGPSGCGKTTTLRCVAGLESADSGRISIKGNDVYASAEGTDVPTHKRSIGMVFQNYAVWPHMTVVQNVEYPLRVQGVEGRIRREQVDRMLKMLGMEQLGNRKPSQLSGGQQQRVALGRALIARPDVLLLDEPLSNLDAKLREQMRSELKRIQREIGVPILYVTHDQIEALSMSDRIAVMNNGEIHQIASPAEIYERPKTKFVLDFIGSVNYLPCNIEEATGEHVELKLVDGQRIQIPRPDYVPAGPRALLAVRPEDMTVAVSSSEEGLRMMVALRSFLGNACEYRMRASGFELLVQTDKKLLLSEGEGVRIEVGRGFLLDADAGDRADARVG